MKIILSIVGLAACALLCLPSRSLALDPEKSIFQFNTQNWTRATGLPADKISSVAQTADGYIWLGTRSGLVRFDGTEFKVVPIGLPEAHGHHVGSLAATPDGKLYFSIVEGGYGMYDGQRFHAVGNDEWKSSSVSANTLFVSRDGTIWGGAAKGSSRWAPDRPGEAKNMEIANVMSYAQERSGRVWIGTSEAGVYTWDDGKLVPFPDPDLAKQNIYAMAVDAKGEAWIGTGRGLYHYDATHRRKEILISDTQVSALLIDRHDVLWIATNHRGLGRYSNAALTFMKQSDGLGSDDVRGLLEDGEGSLWAGTVDGLSQITDVKFPIFSATEGLLSGSGIAITPSAKGGFWLGTASGATYFDGKTAVNYSDPNVVPNAYVRRLYETKNGDVLLCDGGKNINIMREGRLVARYSHDSWPEAFVEDREGLVAAIGRNLLRFKDGKFEPYPFVGEAPTFSWINNMILAKDGALWLATNRGIFRIENGQYRNYTTSDGLTSNRILFIMENDDGAMWVGLATGMLRLKDNRLASIAEEDGLPDNHVFAIVPDNHGSFWLSTGRGIVRVPQKDLNDFADSKSSARPRWTIFDGLESVKFNDRTDQNSSACKTADGRIWFPNPRGVVMIDPQKFSINRVPPKVQVEQLRVNGAVIPLARNSTLKAGERTVEFHFSALSYVAPKKLQVRYQLEGFDPTWIEAGARRSVTYNYLHAGRYTFRVQAANADGVWNTTTDDFKIEVPPPFYRRNWFYVLCSASAIGLLFAAYRWKVSAIEATRRRLTQQNDLLEANVAKRTKELAKSVSLLNATLESVADGIVAIDGSGKVISYNSKFTAIWNFPPDVLASRDATKFRQHAMTLLKDPDSFNERVSATDGGTKPDAYEIFELKDGRIFERYIAPQQIDGENVGSVVNWRDVTERRRAQASAAEASALLHTLLQSTPDYIYFKDRESRFVRYSDVMRERFGSESPDSLIGKTDFDLHTHAFAEAAFADEQEIIRTGQPIIGKLESDKLPDGSMSWALTTKMPWRNPRGEIIGTFGISRNITEIKETEGKLAYERDLLRSLLDSSPDKIYFKDLQSRFLKCSKAQVVNFKLQHPDEMIGKSDFDYFTEEHARPAFEDEQGIIQTGQPVIAKVERESWQDGRETWVVTNKMPLRNGAGEIIGTIGISKDITELKQAEAELAKANQQLVETSRQAGMAEVATSVLHNVGNVLNSVNVSATLVSEQVRKSKIAFVAKVADLLQTHAADLAHFLTSDPRGQKIGSYLGSLSGELLDEQKKMIEELGHLRKNVEHIKEIVAMQQNFAKVSGVTESVSFTELMEDALRINSSSLSRHEVEITRDFQANPNLAIDRHKVMQVLVNLIRNAKYACDESGRTDKRIILRVTQTADRVMAAVIDNGVGIPKDNLTRIFAHGFTTKKEGHGFGLHSGALAAKELGGTLTAMSDGPGCGATFVLDLPVTTSTSASAPETGSGA